MKHSCTCIFFVRFDILRSFIGIYLISSRTHKRSAQRRQGRRIARGGMSAAYQNRPLPEDVNRVLNRFPPDKPSAGRKRSAEDSDRKTDSRKHDMRLPEVRELPQDSPQLKHPLL